jgi:hypothetical protein
MNETALLLVAGAPDGSDVEGEGSADYPAHLQQNGNLLKAFPLLGTAGQQRCILPDSAHDGGWGTQRTGVSGTQGLAKEILSRTVEEDHFPVAVGNHHRLGKLR